MTTMQRRAITQHYWNQYERVQPIYRTDKPRTEKQKNSFWQELKKQSNEDVPTFVLTRLLGLLLIMNIVNQIAKWKGWW